MHTHHPRPRDYALIRASPHQCSPGHPLDLVCLLSDDRFDCHSFDQSQGTVATANWDRLTTRLAKLSSTDRVYVGSIVEIGKLPSNTAPF
jgi:hypothetical protein